MRQPQPWFRTSKKAWYVELDGRQRSLGPHPVGAPPPKKGRTGWNPPKEIREAFKRLHEEEGDDLPPPNRLTVKFVLKAFLRHLKRHADAKRYQWYRRYLKSFNRRCGRRLAAELKPYHVDRWLDGHPTWRNSRRHAITAVKAAFNWADKKGVLSPSPVRGVERPPSASRPHVLARSERAEILAAIKDRQFRDYVEALQETGARPSEIARLTAAEVRLDRGVCELEQHKTAKKTRRPRVIYMTPRLIEIVRPLMLKYPTGPLFRGPRSRKAFGLHGITSRFRRLREKLPHLKHAVAYAFRHGFATDALMNGVGVAQVATLLGHRGTDQVLRHYSHIAEQTDYMRAMAEKAAG